jgi:hypothetical protein
MGAENADIAAGHSKVLAVSCFSGPGKGRGGSARCGLRWLKSSEQHGQIKTVEVLRLRAIKRCVRR